MEGPPLPLSSPTWRPPTQRQSSVGTPHPSEKSASRLPALNFLDLEKIKKEAQDFEHKHPTAITTSAPATSSGPQHPLAGPQSMYSGPPPPYSYPSSAAHASLAFSGYISPPDSRRLSDADKEPQPHRQSLPSIHEALGKDQSILYSGPPAGATVATKNSHSATAPSPGTPIPRSHPETILSGPPNPYASSQLPSPFPGEPTDSRMHPTFRTSSASEEQPPLSSGLPPPDSAPATVHNTPASPAPPQTHRSPRAINAPQPSNVYHSTPQPVQPIQAPQPVTAQPTYPSHPPAYAYPPAPGLHAAYSHFPSSTPWRSDGFEIDRAEEVRKAASKQSSGSQSYGESVKRHLDIFDLETSLNEVSSGVPPARVGTNMATDCRR